MKKLWLWLTGGLLEGLMATVMGGMMVVSSGHLAAHELPEWRLDSGRDHPLVGKIFDPASGKTLSAAAVRDRAIAADAVLLGENHDNPDHHALQTWVVRELAAVGQKPHVAFEMIDSDQREALNRWLAGDRQDLAMLGHMLQWDKSGWPDWSLYLPIAEAAVGSGGLITAANIGKGETRALARNEPDAAALRTRLNLDTPMEAKAEQSLTATIRDSHCNMLPERAIPGMLTVQRARDSSMAHSVADVVANGHKAVLIAGGGHVRKDYAVPAWLRPLLGGKTVLSIGFVEVRPNRIQPQDYADVFDAEDIPFDLIWFTPAAEREDPCVAFRQQKEKKDQAAAGNP